MVDVAPLRHHGLVVTCQSEVCVKTFPQKYLVTTHAKRQRWVFDCGPVNEFVDQLSVPCGRLFTTRTSRTLSTPYNSSWSNFTLNLSRRIVVLMQWVLASSNAPRLISRRHRGRCPAFILTTCEGC